MGALGLWDNILDLGLVFGLPFLGLDCYDSLPIFASSQINSSKNLSTYTSGFEAIAILLSGIWRGDIFSCLWKLVSSWLFVSSAGFSFRLSSLMHLSDSRLKKLAILLEMAAICVEGKLLIEADDWTCYGRCDWLQSVLMWHFYGTRIDRSEHI